jgi:rubrerythrin
MTSRLNDRFSRRARPPERRGGAETTVGEYGGRTYLCQTCGVEFVVPRIETPVCCPICRMNRLCALD